MVTLTQPELDDLYLKGGQAAVDAHFENERKAVFGHDYKLDKNGRPIEQGIGSPAQPSANSVAAYEKYHRGDPGFTENLARMKKQLADFERAHGRSG
jgi:hypothetical protein